MGSAAVGEGNRQRVRGRTLDRERTVTISATFEGSRGYGPDHASRWSLDHRADQAAVGDCATIIVMRRA